MNAKQPTFEEAFDRLEKILDQMNAGNVPLEESLKLFEEGDQLIALCDRYLTSAEKKIEKLIKDRNQDLVLDGEQKPVVEPFVLNRSSDKS